MSNDSSITSRPIRSQSSSSSGEGGLWLVRMALDAHRHHDFQLAFSGAAVDGGAECAEVMVVADTAHFQWRPFSRKPLSLLNSMVRMPNGVR